MGDNGIGAEGAVSGLTYRLYKGGSLLVLRASRRKRKVDTTGQLSACSAISRPEKQKLTSPALGVKYYHTLHILLSELHPGVVWALLALFVS